MRDFDYAVPREHYAMTLRDYFAVHSDQPGVVEIAAAAGVMVNDSHAVSLGAESPWVPFTTWWRSLTQERRLQLSATVRYQMADAMIEARK